jgi:ribonuclease P protein component
MKQTFKKYERLKSKKEISELFKSKKNVFQYPIKAFYTTNKAAQHKIMVSIPKRNFKSAVTRNLLKRRIKESYRKNKVLLLKNNEQKIFLNIAFVYVAKEPLPYVYIDKKINVILQEIANEVYR